MALIIPFNGKSPTIADDAFVAPTAVLIGDVTIKSRASIWFGVVLRGDVASIQVGSGSNVQDNTVVHVDQDAPTTIGESVTIGHGAIVHGCAIANGCQVGMGAIVLSHAVVDEGSMIAAGAVVPEGTNVPPNSVVMGVPGRVRRDVSTAERNALLERAAAYAGRGAIYRDLLTHLNVGAD